MNVIFIAFLETLIGLHTTKQDVSSACDSLKIFSLLTSLHQIFLKFQHNHLLMVCDSITGHWVLIKRVLSALFAHKDLGCILPLRDETMVKMEACLQHSCYNGKAENKVSLSQHSVLEEIQDKWCYAERHLTTRRGSKAMAILINTSYFNVSLY